MKNTIENVVNNTDCSGCSACINICPQQCMEMLPDYKGFMYPHIDDDKCTHCGMCSDVCPIVNKTKPLNFSLPEVYAAWSLNQEIRIQSTSGGIFSELALKILNDMNGYVCGAIYNSQNLVEHYIIHDEKDLHKIRQSKYVQSDKGTVYQQIENLLVDNNAVLFCGAPCECSGLRNYLKKEYDTLYIVDFVCRGANSPIVYIKFLKQLEREYKSRVKRVWFKNKANGWNRFSTRIEFENGKVYQKDRYYDAYIRGYIEANLFMRDSCYKCQFKGFPRHADITLGDFWGIKLDDASLDTDLGTSLIMVNSLKGKWIFQCIENKIFHEKKTTDIAIQGNRCIMDSVKKNKEENEFWNQINNLEIIENIQRFIKKR